MSEHKIKEQPNSIGKITVRRFKAGTLEMVEKLIKEAGGKINDKAAAILQANYLGIATQTKNRIVSSSDHGRNIVAQRLAGTNTYSLNITHGEIGTGSTTPADTDTDLETPTLRKAVTLASVSNNVVTLQFFFNDAELADGTYYEFGTFIDGTATIGTGQMFNHGLLGSGYEKAAGEDTTIEVEITITN